MTRVIRTDGYIELHPDNGKMILNTKTDIRYTVVVCKLEHINNYIEVEPKNQNDENSETEEPTEE